MADWYISPTGNDTTGNGSSGSPWLTLSKAYTGSSSGDTINVAAGTYTWGPNQTVSNRTITGAGASTTIFNAGGAYGFWQGSGTMNISNITFYNMDIATNPGNYGNPNCQSNFAPTGSSASAWTFTNCIFDTLLVTGSYIGLGGVFASANIQVGGYGIEYGNSTFTISGSLFKGIRRSASAGGGSCIFSANCTVRNCTFYTSESTYPLVKINDSGKTYVGLNNIFYNTGSSFAFGTATQTYSDVCGVSSPPSGTGNITSDPLFTDVPNNIFRLRPTSPCRGTGITV